MNPAPRVIILTFYPEEQYAVRALKAGALGYLTKNSGPEEFISAVTEVLDGGTYVSRLPD